MDRSLSPKMIRETLCVSQSAISTTREYFQNADDHINRLQRLIDLMDLLRPLGADGKHADRHTAWCGCEDK